MKRYVIIAGLVGAVDTRAFADEAALPEVADVQDLSLADLLDTEVDVASRTQETGRETPGIITVITRDDIIGSGARDLLDVLALVPGFSPGVDVEGVVDLGVRGQWGHEGKVLLLVDGQPMNELLYSTLQLANHYPLEAIERIEVVRGPGSAIYGGYAELAVINIITRGADMQAFAAATSVGRQDGRLGHADATATFGTTQTGIAGLRVAGTISAGHATSAGTYRDFDGGSYAMAGNGARDPMFAKLAFDYKGLRLDGIFDNYAIQTRDGTGPVVAATAHQGFRGYYVDAHYTVGLGHHLTLTPKLALSRQQPWKITDKTSELFYSKTVTRYTAGAALEYTPSERLQALGGVETYLDRAHLDDPTLVGFQTQFGSANTVAYDTIATYGQVIAKHRLANLTVGARYEHHSAVGGSLVPRIALTRVIGRFHAKLLASQAFRAPGIENINLSGGQLAPEKTTVFEGELGYELTDNMYVGLNAFDLTIKKPIVYDFDQASDTEIYQNFDRTGTRGVEVDYRVKYKRGYGSATYSYYTARGKNEVTAYAVPGHDEALLAFPSHKLTLSGRVNVVGNLTVAPSAVIYGPRYGYTATDMVERMPALGLVNVYASYRDLGVKGLELGAGVYDIADQHIKYLQPYNGGHAPLPGPGREVIARIAYETKL